MKLKFLLASIVMIAVAAGALLYYLQVYAYYEEVSAEVSSVELTSIHTGAPEEILFENFTAIDSDSSPIRYRACFTTPVSYGSLTDNYVIYDKAEPLVAPSWFNCFDAKEIGAALETGEAVAFLGTENVSYGIDRIVAVMPDGRGFVWHQINHCGEVVFDGDKAPEGCPVPPEGIN
ncbi:DUF6446 family protein [Marivivens sp. LCG002]|uniref:DUF6446 family protein n=1 Tax=Marivivens sp. LCG002 TaxID=3051171 RepID=UPI00255214FB|nr:DUF6446 family protein [Marivivens sp. LCG002]WIV49889.1 DUF6446 family protein [Marivivens sp. LCG002]